MQIPISCAIMLMAISVIATLVLSHLVKEMRAKKTLDFPDLTVKAISVVGAICIIAEIIFLISL